MHVCVREVEVEGEEGKGGGREGREGEVQCGRIIMIIIGRKYESKK